jgi:transposase-like protein
MKRTTLRTRRIFSESLRKKIVSDLDSGKASIAAVMREYEVSHQTVYNWVNKYSRHLQSYKTIVLQMDSEGYKTKELEKRVKELEAALGRKQLEVEFLNKMIELGKEKFGIDLKKNYASPPSSGSAADRGSTEGK